MGESGIGAAKIYLLKMPPQTRRVPHAKLVDAPQAREPEGKLIPRTPGEHIKRPRRSLQPQGPAGGDFSKYLNPNGGICASALGTRASVAHIAIVAQCKTAQQYHLEVACPHRHRILLRRQHNPCLRYPAGHPHRLPAGIAADTKTETETNSRFHGCTAVATNLQVCPGVLQRRSQGVLQSSSGREPSIPSEEPSLTSLHFHDLDAKQVPSWPRASSVMPHLQQHPGFHHVCRGKPRKATLR